MTARSPDDARRWARLASRRLLHHPLRFDGRPRGALLYVPRHRLNDGQLPLILMLHGGASTPDAIARASAMHRIGEREGCLVAYPFGVRGKSGLTWRPTRADEPGGTDILFLRDLMADLSRAYPVDLLRVFVAGFSIGGSLTYEFACESAGQIAAIGVVGGTMLEPARSPLRPVPLIHIHGTKDRRVPLRGGKGAATSDLNIWPPVRAGIERWCAFNKCAVEPEVIRLARDGITRYVHRGRAPVELWLVERGGHSWPGSRREITPEDLVGPHLPSFSASEELWRFFAANGRGRRVMPSPRGRDLT